MKILYRKNAARFGWEPWFAWYPILVHGHYDVETRQIVRDWRWLEIVYRNWDDMTPGGIWTRGCGRWSYISKERKEEYDAARKEREEREKDVWTAEKQ
jgi:hypothetical protein